MANHPIYCLAVFVLLKFVFRPNGWTKILYLANQAQKSKNTASCTCAAKVNKNKKVVIFALFDITEQFYWLQSAGLVNTNRFLLRNPLPRTVRGYE